MLRAVGRGARANPPAMSKGTMSSVVQAMEYRGRWLHYILLERGASVDDVGAEGVRKGCGMRIQMRMRVGIESAGESLQLAYELHAQSRRLLIRGMHMRAHRICRLDLSL